MSRKVDYIYNQEPQAILDKINELIDEHNKLVDGKYGVLTVEPQRPQEGDTVNADGTNWNPGSGAGRYTYVGGAWVKL